MTFRQRYTKNIVAVDALQPKGRGKSGQSESTRDSDSVTVGGSVAS